MWITVNDAPNKKIYFNSKYLHGIDEKRRLQIPAKWRPEEEGVEFTVILWPKHQAGTCLRVLPPDKLEKLVAEIEAMPNSDPRKDVLRRVVGGNSEQVTVDKAGRICLPEAMATAAGIKDQALLVGMFERFEIWEPERYKLVEAADAVHQAKAFEMM
jgi:MraZ protein